MAKFTGRLETPQGVPGAMFSNAIHPAQSRNPQVRSGPQLAPTVRPLQSKASNTGVLMLGLYIISGYATDVMLLTLGIKPYLSTLTGLAVLLIFLTSGRALRALQTTSGKLWLFMMVWLIIDLPFSYWPGSSYAVLTNYLPKLHVIFFFMCALALTVEDCAVLAMSNVIGCFALLFECFKFGAGDDSGRFAIENSISFNNPNDLGLQLVVSMGYFTYLIVGNNAKARWLGLLGLLASFYYMLKTASRGSLLACGVMFMFCVIFTRFRLKMFLLAIPVVAVMMAMPGNTMHRLTLIFLSPELSAATTVQDRASMESQLERQELLKASVEYMFTHPVFGIGEGQFSDYHWAQLKQAGHHVASLGTHNSYTEIGSECGLPVLFCFAGTLIFSIVSNFRIYKRTERDPAMKKFTNLSFCLLLGTLGYAVNAFFHHGAYASYVPVLGGLSAALYLAAKPAPPNLTQPRAVTIGR